MTMHRHWLVLRSFAAQEHMGNQRPLAAEPITIGLGVASPVSLLRMAKQSAGIFG
jgi:hypothetical protein